ncbi:MAG: hypothetical protein OXE99_09990 [Cellvibrionales bacterium]|nr:hypothetical protein [Cellvibrionales bacterium]
MNKKLMTKLKQIDIKQALDSLAIEDTPNFPLALNVNLPDDHVLDHGNVSFRFKDFRLTNEGQVSIHAKASKHSGYQSIKLCIDRMQLTGCYAIDALQTDAVDLDLGGTLMPFDSEFNRPFNRPRPAGTDEGTGFFSDDQKTEYLDQAREQRTRLMDTANGQQIMGVYDEHEEVYTEMFQSSAAVRATWQQGNVTADMASHTSDAIKADTAINPAPEDKMFGEGFYQMGYNNNALIQQVTLATACMAAAKKASDLPVDADLPDNKYSKAALAASQFKQTVATTGNTEDQTQSMTSSEVFTTVDTHSGDVPQMTLAELNNMQSQSKGTGGSAAAMEAEQKGWIVLSEVERAQMRDIMTRCYAEFCEYDAREPQLLWQGDCSASLSGIEVNVQFSEASGDFAIESVILPVFDFELDDAHWQGEAADIARSRLAQVHFVRSLIHEKIVSALKEKTLATLTKH